MARTKIPDDANIYIEVGTKRPSEMAYDPFLPFEMLWVITNGKIRRNFLWVTVRESGIYVASGGPDHYHTSYHSDGTFHWKRRNHAIPMDKRPCLPNIAEPVLIQSATADINDDVLLDYELTEFDDHPVDRVIYLDNRMLPDAVNYYVWAVPPFRHYCVPLFTEHPAHIHIITHTNPWIQVVIYEEGERKNAKDE